MYHVLNGDCLADQLRQTKINQDFVVCRECLVEGDLLADSLTDFWSVRAKYIAEAFDTSAEQYFHKTVRELEKLNFLPDRADVCLWFENDLFCQANMWFVISQLARNSTLTLFRIFPVIESKEDTWKGFGMADTEKLERAFSSRIQFTPGDIKLGENLWNAYRHGNLNELKELSKTKSACFDFLEEVCQAHAERFPEDKSPGRPERVIREIMNTQSKEFPEVFSAFTDQEGIYGFSDLQVRRIYDKIVHGH